MVTNKRVLRRDDMKLPTLRRLDDLRQGLVQTLGFSSNEAVQLTHFLQHELVPATIRFMKAQSPASTASKDRATVKSAVNSLRKARLYLDSCGLPVRMTIEPSLGSLGEMFSALWLRENIPGGDYLPRSVSREGEGRGRLRTGTRGAHVDIEQDSFENRFHFLRSRGFYVIVKALAKMEKEMEFGVRRSVQRRGRKSNTYRDYFIQELISFWKYRLRKPTPQTIGSDLGTFCHRVFESVGWPTGGLDAAIQKQLSSRN